MIDSKNAYEGVEALENFISPERVEAYRRHVLEKSVKQAGFIKQNFSEEKSILEGCCGNGRLLFSLADSFERLEGFDFSKSRIEFAKAWAQDLGMDHVHIWQDDLFDLSQSVAAASFDLVVCITGAFGYFDGVKAGNDIVALEQLARAARPGGGLILELYQLPSVVRMCNESEEKTYRKWSELPSSDPFRFSLSEYRFEPEHRIVSHAKTFIHRNGSVDEGRVEFLRIYRTEELEELLSPLFTDVFFYKNWNGDPFSEEGESMIITARRLPE